MSRTVPSERQNASRPQTPIDFRVELRELEEVRRLSGGNDIGAEVTNGKVFVGRDSVRRRAEARVARSMFDDRTGKETSS